MSASLEWGGVSECRDFRNGSMWCCNLARDAQDLRADAAPEPGMQKDCTEVRANVFAAHFPMPETEVRAAWEHTVTDLHTPTDAELSELVVTFTVSPSAPAARLHRLGLFDTARRDRFRAV